MAIISAQLDMKNDFSVPKMVLTLHKWWELFPPDLKFLGLPVLSCEQTDKQMVAAIHNTTHSRRSTWYTTTLRCRASKRWQRYNWMIPSGTRTLKSLLCWNGMALLGLVVSQQQQQMVAQRTVSHSSTNYYTSQISTTKALQQMTISQHCNTNTLLTPRTMFQSTTRFLSKPSLHLWPRTNYVQ